MNAPMHRLTHHIQVLLLLVVMLAGVSSCRKQEDAALKIAQEVEAAKNKAKLQMALQFDRGRRLFKDVGCARCHHTQLEKNSTAPALYGLRERVPSEGWIYQFIWNSQKLIASGDAYAIQVFEENNMSMMTPYPQLKRSEIADIIAWIYAYQPATASEP